MNYYTLTYELPEQTKSEKSRLLNISVKLPVSLFQRTLGRHMTNTLLLRSN